METGYVYIFTNPSFKDNVIKIGQTTNPDTRIKELDKTGVPMPFEKYATLKTAKYIEVEKLVHSTLERLTDYKVRENREFYNVTPEKALDILRDISLVLDDGDIEVFKSDEKSDDVIYTGRRASFRFNMVNIPVGETITFTPNGMEVKVYDNDKVEYKERQYSLSNFTKTFMPENKRNKSDSYQGPKYFTYNGKTLVELRDEFENK